MEAHSGPRADGEHGDIAERGSCWWPDADLHPATREALGEFLTPRRGLNGELHWPVDELRAADD
jgi:hypothetical protein